MSFWWKWKIYLASGLHSACSRSGYLSTSLPIFLRSLRLSPPLQWQGRIYIFVMMSVVHTFGRVEWILRIMGQLLFAFCFLFESWKICVQIACNREVLLKPHKGLVTVSVCDLHGQNFQVQLMSGESLMGFIRPWPPAHTWAVCNRVWSSWNESPHLRFSARKWSENASFGLERSCCLRWSSSTLGFVPRTYQRE